MAKTRIERETMPVAVIRAPARVNPEAALALGLVSAADFDRWVRPEEMV
jgi:hypothetical protein